MLKSDKKQKVHYVRWVLPPYRAMTIPPFGIFIKKEHKNNQKIFNHEMIHWQQYKRMGLLKFYWQYLKEFFKYGYNDMPMEMEARYEESEYNKIHYVEVYHKNK